MKLTLTFISAVLLSADAFAWGPHSEIAQAALDAMGANDPLVQRLGPDAKRLAQYVWMADLRQSLLVRSDAVFYADDYLLFPAAGWHDLYHQQSRGWERRLPTPPAPHHRPEPRWHHL
jgi:hypothetical protein